ncbi:centrosomal protein 43 [Halyomorpha halys]|uniref:centrosomal protein 43 n=1 Tax=Halyomorpha halys TaxID=286706 RepID=UPI0006D4E8EC|nr:FGFR1 oncogene partner [Halyomorpha halys]
MPVEEHKELRELVSHTLQAKGVLQKVQAEIRASVFLALEEQDVFKDKNPFINAPLKNYLATTEGLLAVSLIKEFLDFFNLEFTSLVFDPETHAGIDYTYEGRQKISKDLKIDIIDNKVPLLGLVLKILTSAYKNSDASVPSSLVQKKEVTSNVEKNSEITDNLVSNGINGSLSRKGNNSEEKASIAGVVEEKDNRHGLDMRTGMKKEVGVSSSLSSLGDLPPLTKPTPQIALSESHKQKSNEEGKGDIVIDEGSSSNDDVFPLPTTKMNKDLKNDSNMSEDSEIEEDISEAASAPTEDNTADLSISKGSGKADYLEDL